MNLIGRDGRTRRTDRRTDNPAYDYYNIFDFVVVVDKSFRTT
jgi:hypothetical protein